MYYNIRATYLKHGGGGGRVVHPRRQARTEKRPRTGGSGSINTHFFVNIHCNITTIIMYRKKIQLKRILLVVEPLTKAFLVLATSIVAEEHVGVTKQ